MKLALLLLSVTLLLLAVAAELWWGGAARQRRKQHLAHVEQRLVDGRTGMPLVNTQGEAARDGRHWDYMLLRAGLRGGLAGALPLLIPGLLFALLGAWRIGTPWAALVIAALYVAIVWLWLRMRIEKQQKLMLRQLPDFLDGMVRLTGIGNSLPMAFQTTAANVPMPLRGVLDRALVSVRAGVDLDRALQLASQPYKLDALELLHVVLGTGMRMGGRADMILQRMADFMRDLAHAQQELKAITSETRMSAWVLGLLPIVVAVFMTLANPGFFKPMFEQPLGHQILLIALGLELIGAGLLYRLAKSL